MNELTAASLKEHLLYSPDTGLFTWAISKRGVRIGAIAGCIHPRGYRRISIFCTVQMAHRLAWLYVHGVWPKGEIDHINGDKADNRICNLREASRIENMQNQHRAQSNSASGLLGAEPTRRRPRKRERRSCANGLSRINHRRFGCASLHQFKNHYSWEWQHDYNYRFI